MHFITIKKKSFFIIKYIKIFIRNTCINKKISRIFFALNEINFKFPDNMHNRF